LWSLLGRAGKPPLPPSLESKSTPF
jgi:hypothetical protein